MQCERLQREYQQWLGGFTFNQDLLAAPGAAKTDMRTLDPMGRVKAVTNNEIDTANAVSLPARFQFARLTELKPGMVEHESGARRPHDAWFGLR